MTTPVKIDAATHAECHQIQLLDDFSEDCEAGMVIGSSTAGGIVRRGRDAERQIAIDHGALRFQPLVTPGWARQGIAYGPFRRENGLILAVSITNGHNTSQGTAIPEHIVKRIYRWAVGPNADPWPKRLIAWVWSPRRRGTLRRILWWMRSTRKSYNLPDMNENLAIGWFTSEAPRDPLSDGCGFIMHAALGENGELWARVGKRCLSAFRRLKNLKVHYFVVLRERGAVYYAAAMEDAHGLAALPMMRPIAIDPFNEDEILYAGVHQCVLGQIGFRVDTRVHGIRIQQVSELASRFGSAHVGDPLTGGSLADGAAGLNGAWHVLCGDIVPTRTGARATVYPALAIADPGVPTGLLHAVVATTDAASACGLVWRVRDRDNFWLFRVSGDEGALLRVEDGVETVVVRAAQGRLEPSKIHSLQILDGYGEIGCYLDGDRLFAIEDKFLERSTGTGIWFGGGSMELRDFEAHPRAIPVPHSLRPDAGWSRFGRQTEFADDFFGASGDLAGRAARNGNGTWEKTVGVGFIDVHDGAAHVRGTLENPHPNRTFHTLPWYQPDFADLEVTITPPGEVRGQSHRCRAGLVFWQDPDNYCSFSIWLDDIYDGASVALFPKRHGFEELYDAIWTMVWHKIHWGKPFRLRIPFDGERFVIFVDDEPVMQRALTDLYPDDTPLRIRRVGLAVNWEWGNDTGSTFQAFAARR